MSRTHDEMIRQLTTWGEAHPLVRDGGPGGQLAGALGDDRFVPRRGTGDGFLQEIERWEA